MVDQTEQLSLTNLVEEHYERLYAYGYRLSGSASDAEDLVQHTFMKAQQCLDQLREPAHAQAWLYRILRNHYLKKIRKDQKLNFVDMNVQPPEVEESLNSDFDISSEDLQASLMEIPEDFRSPLILFYFEELSYKQIAEYMECPIGTVMSRLTRARNYLRKALLEKIPDAVDIAT